MTSVKSHCERSEAISNPCFARDGDCHGPPALATGGSPRACGLRDDPKVAFAM